MNMTLYGICFKLRGGPDLLDYIQSNKPVPVEIMGQVMEQMGSITPAETAFAEKLQADWKMAMNERIPLLMSIAKDGSYDITCTVPDALLETVKLVTGKEYEQIVGDYTSTYLKDICGVDTEIVSVDVDDTEEPAVHYDVPAKAAPVGFDISALEEDPEGPMFEDVAGIDVEQDIPEMDMQPVAQPVAVPKPVKQPEPVRQTVPEPEAEPEPAPEEYPEEYPEDEQGYAEEYGEDEQSYEEELPYGEDEGVAPEEEVPAEEEAVAEEEGADSVQSAVAGIYKEMVTNIRDRKLDERLGLRIGQ